MAWARKERAKAGKLEKEVLSGRKSDGFHQPAPSQRPSLGHPRLEGSILPEDQHYTVLVGLHCDSSSPCTPADQWSSELNCSLI